MNPITASLLALLPIAAGAEKLPVNGLPNHVVLELIDDSSGQFNQANIGFEIVLGNSTATSDLTGCVEVTLNIDPATHTTDQLTLLSADVQAADVTLSGGSPLLGTYTMDIVNLDLEMATPDPPGLVIPETGVFDAAQYQFTIVDGQLDGLVNSSFVGPDPVPVAYDYGAQNFTGTGEGSGAISLNPTLIDSGRQFYEVTAEFPVIFTQNVEDDSVPVPVTVIINGTIKATGTTYTYLPGFPQWAADQGLMPDSQAAFDLSPTAPNEILYALGFTSENAPREILTITPEAVIVAPQAVITREDVELQWSSNLKDWERIPQEFMLAGNSAITAGTNLDDSIGSGNRSKPYFRLAIPEETSGE